MVQKTPNCHSEKMVEKDEDSWILMELCFLSSQSLPLREFSQARPVGSQSISNRWANHRSDGAPGIFPVIPGWKCSFSRQALGIVLGESLGHCTLFEKGINSSLYLVQYTFWTETER